MSDEDKKVDSMIDKNLKRAFQDVIDEQLPDRFSQLLDQLSKDFPEKNGDGDSENE